MAQIGHLATTEIAKAQYGSDVIIITRHREGYKIVNPRDVKAIKGAIKKQTIFGVVDFDKGSLLSVIKAVKDNGLRCEIVDPM